MAVPEVRQLFEAAVAQTSGLVNHVLSVFFQCKQPFSGKTDGYFSSPLHNETSSWRRDLLEAKHQLFSTRFFLILFFLAGLS